MCLAQIVHRQAGDPCARVFVGGDQRRRALILFHAFRLLRASSAISRAMNFFRAAYHRANQSKYS